MLYCYHKSFSINILWNGRIFDESDLRHRFTLILRIPRKMWRGHLKVFGWKCNLCVFYWTVSTRQRAQRWHKGPNCHVSPGVPSSAANRLICEVVQSRAFSWLKAPTSAFTFKTLLRHYAKRALTPRSLKVKLGPRCNGHRGRGGWLA